MSDQGKEVAEVKEKEDWMNAKWRPAMGWMYMLVCTCDFVIFPVLWSLIQTMGHGRIETQWQPITLSGAGLFHMAMGAIIGVAAFGRTQEKLAGKANDNAGSSAGPTSFGTTSAPSSFSSPAPTNSFSSSNSFTPAPAPSSFGSSTPAVNANGQKVVPAQSFPEL